MSCISSLFLSLSLALSTLSSQYLFILIWYYVKISSSFYLFIFVTTGDIYRTKKGSHIHFGKAVTGMYNWREKWLHNAYQLRMCLVCFILSRWEKVIAKRPYNNKRAFLHHCNDWITTKYWEKLIIFWFM